MRGLWSHFPAVWTPLVRPVVDESVHSSSIQSTFLLEEIEVVKLSGQANIGAIPVGGGGGVHLVMGRKFYLPFSWRVHPQPPELPLESRGCLTLFIMLHLFPFQPLFKCLYKVHPPPNLLGLHPNIILFSLERVISIIITPLLMLQRHLFFSLELLVFKHSNQVTEKFRQQGNA